MSLCKWGACDVNPDEYGKGLNLNISENDNALEIELALEVHKYFRIDRKRAEEIISQLKNAVKNWRQIADRYNISKAEQELKAPAFA